MLTADELAEIDELIRPLVLILDGHPDFETYTSCQGNHPPEDEAEGKMYIGPSCDPYVGLEVRGLDGFRKLLALIVEVNNRLQRDAGGYAFALEIDLYAGEENNQLDLDALLEWLPCQIGFRSYDNGGVTPEDHIQASETFKAVLGEMRLRGEL